MDKPQSNHRGNGSGDSVMANRKPLGASINELNARLRY